MNDTKSNDLSDRAARKRIRRAGVALLVLSLLAPWFRDPLSAWLTATSAAGLILGVMILKRSHRAISLAMAVPVIVLLIVAGRVLMRRHFDSWQVWVFIAMLVAAPITILLLFDARRAFLRHPRKAHFYLPSGAPSAQFSRVVWLICGGLVILAAVGGHKARRHHMGMIDLPVMRPAKVRWLTWRLEHGDSEDQRAAVSSLRRIGPEAENAVPALIRAVRSEDPAVAHDAIRVLSEFGPRAGESVPALVDALDSGYFEVRLAAAQELGEIGPAAGTAAERLKAIVENDPERRVVDTATFALRRLGEAGIRPFLADLTDQDPEMRQQAAKHLQNVLRFMGSAEPAGAEKVLPELINALKDDDPVVRRPCLDTIGSALALIDDPEVQATAIEPLVQLIPDLRSLGKRLRWATAAQHEVLGKSYSELSYLNHQVNVTLLTIQDRDAVIDALEDEADRREISESPRPADRSSRTTAERLIHLMARWEEMSRFCEGALAEIGAPAFQALVEVLLSDDEQLRRAGAQALKLVLEKTQDSKLMAEAVDPLARALLLDPQVGRRASGALAVIARDNPRLVVESLEKALEESRQNGEAASARARRGSTAERLIRLMAEREEIRSIGSSALQAIGEAALDPLIEAARSEDAETRRLAIGTLYLMTNVKMTASNRERLEATFAGALGEWKAGTYAALGLDAIGTETARERMRQAAEPLARSLLNLSKGAGAEGSLGIIARHDLAAVVGALGKALEEARRLDPFIRLPEPGGTSMERLARMMAERREIHDLAVQVFQHIGDDALEPLIAAFQSDDDRIRRVALMTLSLIADDLREASNRERLEPLLAGVLDDEALGGYAAVGLHKLGTDSAREAIRNAGYKAGEWGAKKIEPGGENDGKPSERNDEIQ